MTICNMLTSIRNAQIIKRPFLYQKNSKKCERILDVLWNEGYILGYQKIHEKNKQKIKVFLKYYKSKPAIQMIKPFSKPGRHIYYSLPQLWKINSKNSFLILSTNKGIKTLNECKRYKIGGKPLLIMR